MYKWCSKYLNFGMNSTRVAYSICLVTPTSPIGDPIPQLCPASVTQPPVFYSNLAFIGANVTPWYFWSTSSICFHYACATITPTSSLYLFKLLLYLNLIQFPYFHKFQRDLKVNWTKIFFLNEDINKIQSLCTSNI